jgi:putative ribosome biogenesis GTPase RsgA
LKRYNRVNDTLDLAEALDKDFEEIVELARSCKFSNCTHTGESECAVKKALSEGILSEERFNTYVRLKKEIEYLSSQKNKTKAVDYMRKKKMFYREKKI